ncbi:MAG: MFS transporter [Pseudonocardiaceae bacterium]
MCCAAWAARGLRVPARNALLADVVPAEVYGRAYGFERTMDNPGAIVGPLLALGLVSLFSIRTAILISVVPGLMAAGAIMYAIRQAKLPKVTERTKLRFRVRPVLRGRLGRVIVGSPRSRWAMSRRPCSSCALPTCSPRGAAWRPPRRSRSRCMWCIMPQLRSRPSRPVDSPIGSAGGARCWSPPWE